MTDDHTHRGDDVHPVEAAIMGDGGWQPIETAKKDGNLVIWIYDGCNVESGFWEPDEGWVEKVESSSGFNYYYHIRNAKQWHPMFVPAAPTEGE